MSDTRLLLLAATVALLGPGSVAAQETASVVLAVENAQAGLICPIERLNEIYRDELAEQMADDPRALISIRKHVAHVCIRQQRLLTEVWRGDQQLRERFGIEEGETAVPAAREKDPQGRILEALLEAITAGDPSTTGEAADREATIPVPDASEAEPGADILLLLEDGVANEDPAPGEAATGLPETALRQHRLPVMTTRRRPTNQALTALRPPWTTPSGRGSIPCT